MEGDIKKLMDVLNGQDLDGVLSHDWDQIEPVIEVIEEDNPTAGHHKGDTNVHLKGLSIIFIFDSDQKLKGICNWKE